MQKTITTANSKREELCDITGDIQRLIRESGIKTGIANVYVQGATAGIMIQENWDDSVQNDVVTMLRQIAPQGIWEHDRQDGNGDSHLKAGLVGPSESIPVINGEAGLSTWQNIFLCEFDGPRNKRSIVVTIAETQP
jgi:secondary thiamine-phosphate synthase enzyme